MRQSGFEESEIRATMTLGWVFYDSIGLRVSSGIIVTTLRPIRILRPSGYQIPWI